MNADPHKLLTARRTRYQSTLGGGRPGWPTARAIYPPAHVRLKTHLVNTPLLGNDDRGIYLYNGSGLVKLVRTNEVAPQADVVHGGLMTRIIDG